ncbi:MAG: hypothetical protein OEU90_02245 [Gammaproteobacteria bacterium]|jgi:hypothetical protein|nr:hypothetical protein [Gammaproteobacteria bacterium]MDH3749823.1 hypothetical protein [Gammaproteobacteria bacterium]MDH3804272.1 hypothetical protein [Gammaproteobacteria bacterium]
MRKTLSLFLFAGMTRIADAHTLTSDDGLPMQLVHQLLGSHHLPMTALIVLAGILVFRVWHRRFR